MITYISIGADDMESAEHFYSSFLQDLGYRLERIHGELSYTLPKTPGRVPDLPEFYVKFPFDGRPASAGNGTMVAFEARSQQQVRTLHAAALAAGGSSEGEPGFRDAYGANFFVGYLRDPQGNKISIYSNDPKEPGRDD